MKFSINNTFFPDNTVLEKALARYVQLASGQIQGQILPDQNVLAPDNYSNTCGNYEQRQYDLKLLADARDFFSELLSDILRQENPLGWADTQNQLGNILGALAQQANDSNLYIKAIESFTVALEEFKQDEQPKDWAATQYNLGIAYQAQGRLLKEQKSFKKSVDAFTDTLLEWSRSNEPKQWALSLIHI